jgi:hypothetical protein
MLLKLKFSIMNQNIIIIESIYIKWINENCENKTDQITKVNKNIFSVINLFHIRSLKCKKMTKILYHFK